MIDLKGVSYTYDTSETPALNDINLTISRGETVGIAGASGSGKSTLARLLAGLIEPTSGSMKSDPDIIRGIVFQNPESQLFAPTVFDDIAFGPRNLLSDDTEITAWVNQAISFVGLSEDTLEKNPFSLSGGQQRKVALAGVVALHPDVLILDEPAAGLDPQSRADFLDNIAELNATGTTVVFVSHEMDDLASYCPRIILLDEGRCVADDSPAAVFAETARLEHYGLSLPEIYRLTAALRAAGVLKDANVVDEASLIEAIKAALK